MADTSKDECSFASKSLNLRDRVGRWSSSTALPLGCASYNNGKTKGYYVYYAPMGTKKTPYSYYSAICKKKSAKTCKCAGGAPAFGYGCPKNGATACASCFFGQKLAKGSCTPMYKTSTYTISSRGTCPKNYQFITSNQKECTAAVKALKFKPSRTYKTTSRGIPRGCSVYKTGKYLYWAPQGITTYDYAGLGAYAAVCKHVKSKTCVCANGEAPHGSACPKNGAKKCLSCHPFYTANKAKTACLSPASKSKNYVFSSNG